MKARFFILSIFVSFSMASATIINVPADSSTIQGGINGSSNGDTVLVQPGTYVENINFSGHNIVLGSLFLTTGDTSYISTTIIDGDSAGTVVTFDSGEDSTAVIIGFTIQKGSGVYGGAINCSGRTISQNIIKWNYATDNGGGINCQGGTLVIINENIITENNSSDHGGGICFRGSGPAIVQENIISGNYSSKYGGGICFRYGDRLEIVGNIIIGNHSNWEGGGICSEDDPSFIIDNIISGNSSGDDGGGIYCLWGPDTVQNNIIAGNISQGNGGGIALFSCGAAVVEYNLIYGNVAYYYGGGMASWTTSYPIIRNNSVSRNSAYRGGDLYSGPNSTQLLINNVFWEDSADTGNEIYIHSGTPDFSYCDIEDTLWLGEGNISCDPQFCEPDSGNFELNAFSCCAGAGQNGVDIGARGIGCWNCEGYVIGDINDSGDYNGLDVNYGVSYLKGRPPPPYQCVCTPGNIWYASGDVSGSCSYNGLDITYGVSYLKGIHTELFPCPDCPPVR